MIAQCRQFLHHLARRRLVAQRMGKLQDDDDHADPGHEPGHHGLRHQLDVMAEAEQAEQDLEGPGEHHRRECHREVAAEFGEDQGHHHRHRPGGPRNLVACAAKHRGKKTGQDGAPQSRQRTGAGSDTEGQRQRQRHDGGS
jgi:hypothetical protein